MSLIHNAMSALEGQPRGPHGLQSSPAPSPATSAPSVRGWLLAGAVAAAAVTAGAAGAAWLSTQHGQSTELRQNADAPTVFPPSAPLVVSTGFVPLQREVDLPSLVVTHGGASPNGGAVEHGTEQAGERGAQDAQDAPVKPAAPPIRPKHAVQSSVRPAHLREGASTAPPPSTESLPPSRAGEASIEEVERLVARIQREIESQRHEDAAASLQQLGSMLPPESITLLRLRAWHALRTEDLQTARGLYRTIVERLPEDEPALINLALSYWKLGHKEQARRLVTGLAERRPDSAAVRHALAQFGVRS